MAHSGSRGRPEPVAPEFLPWRRTEVKISPPKVTGNWKLARVLLFQMFVLGNEATFLLEFFITGSNSRFYGPAKFGRFPKTGGNRPNLAATFFCQMTISKATFASSEPYT